MKFESLSAVTVLLLITLLSGCGRKTTLVPPQKLAPEKIVDLRYILDEKGVTLMWGYPAEMENGDRLQAIDSFEIYRAVIPEDEFCQGCPVHYEEPIEIAGGRLPASGNDRTASYIEGFLQRGYRYLYKVRSRTSWWYSSSDSNVVSFVWNVSPKVPQGLQAEPGDGTITLVWDPVVENIEGEPLEHDPQYQVYRKSEHTDFSTLGEPVHEARFLDSGLQNERYYFYQVRALAVSADTVQAGGASQIVAAMPLDQTPPPQPRHLVAIEIPGGVKLAWQAVAHDNLAGYKIYRRRGISSTPELLAEVGPDKNQYTDHSMLSGGKWFYSVTSFDTAQPANESLPAEEAVIHLR